MNFELMACGKVEKQIPRSVIKVSPFYVRVIEDVGPNKFDGTVANGKFYPRVLTPEQVKAEYEKSK